MNKKSVKFKEKCFYLCFFQEIIELARIMNQNYDSGYLESRGRRGVEAGWVINSRKFFKKNLLSWKKIFSQSFQFERKTLSNVSMIIHRANKSTSFSWICWSSPHFLKNPDLVAQHYSLIVKEFDFRKKWNSNKNFLKSNQL